MVDDVVDHILELKLNVMQNNKKQKETLKSLWDINLWNIIKLEECWMLLVVVVVVVWGIFEECANFIDIYLTFPWLLSWNQVSYKMDGGFDASSSFLTCTWYIYTSFAK